MLLWRWTHRHANRSTGESVELYAAALLLLLGVLGQPRLLHSGIRAAVYVRVQRADVAELHGVVANASQQKSEERVPVGPIGAAGVPLERARLRRLVNLNRVPHVMVVEVRRARDDIVLVRDALHDRELKRRWPCEPYIPPTTSLGGSEYLVNIV